MVVERRPGNVGAVIMGRDKCLLLLHVIKQAGKWTTVHEQLAANSKIGMSGVMRLALLQRLDQKWFGNLKRYVEEREERVPFKLDELVLDGHAFKSHLTFGPNDRVRAHLLSDQTKCFYDVIEVALMILRGEIVQATEAPHGFTITHKEPLPAAPAPMVAEEGVATAT